MKHSQARQIKWDLVDQLLTTVIDDEGHDTFSQYTDEEKAYALDQIRRMARMFNVTNHVYL